MHATHSVFIINAIEAFALQKYNSLSADEKKGIVAKYIAGGGIKGNLQQVLSNVETSSSSKETTSQVIEGYMFLGIVAIYVLCPLKKPIGYTQHLGDSSEESCTELAVFFKYIL